MYTLLAELNMTINITYSTKNNIEEERTSTHLVIFIVVWARFETLT